MNEATSWTNLLLEKQQQQALADQHAEAIHQQQINGIFDSAGRLSAAMSQRRNDAIANKLINEQRIPRATAVDAQGRPNIALNKAARTEFPKAATMADVDPASGGVAEQEMRKKYGSPLQQQMELNRRITSAEQRYRSAPQAMQQPAYRTEFVAQPPSRYPSATPGQSSGFTPLAAGSEPDFTQPVAEISTYGIPKARTPNFLPAPSAAIDALRKNPALAPHFDAKYGHGAAAAYTK